jgi:DNA-binding response OmpR family regulator
MVLEDVQMAEILIVEDDVDLVETYMDLLVSSGHSAIHATHLNMAREQFLIEQPKIVMLDLNLPGSSSADIAEFVHKVKENSRSKIIVVSGHPEMMDTELVDYADLVLTKPVDNHDLRLMVDRLLLRS